MGLFEDEGEANVKYEDGKIKRVVLERRVGQHSTRSNAIGVKDMIVKHDVLGH